MIDIEEKGYVKYVLFSSLYFAEGIEIIVAMAIVPVYLVDQGVSTAVATLVAGIAMLPWALKFIWGGMADYFIKYGRKRFIVLGGLIAAGSFFMLAVIDPGVALLPFAVFLFIGHCGTGFLDVSADAWAIQTTQEHERGKINGVMFAGLFIGQAVGSSLFASIAGSAGYGVAFMTIGGMIFLLVLFPLFVHENILVKIRQKVAALLVGEFKKKTTQIVSVFLPALAISSGLVAVVVPLFLKEILELDVSQIGIIVAMFPLGTMVGAVLGGVTTDRWGRKINLYFFVGLSIIFSASLAVANTWQSVAIMFGIVGFLRGGWYAAMGALLMDITNPKIGATQYSLLTSFANAGEIVGGAVAGSLIVLLGYTSVFLFCGWLFGPALLILYFIRPKATFAITSEGVIEDAM
ncbi:MAG: MFS transporter [Thermoplasmatota archaeon]